MSMEMLELGLQFAPILFLLVLGFAAGTIAERRHFSSIREREAQFRTLPAINFATVPAEWSVESSGLVSGGVVVSLDYFKRFAASLRIIFGGRVRAFEPLMDRGRREALLRMKQDAAACGYDAIINVRLDTARIANADGATTAGVELFAYGTGLRLRQTLQAADALRAQDA